MSLDVAICGAWSGSDPLLQEVSETFRVEDTPYIQTTVTCASKNYFLWLALIIVYKTALSLCAVCLSLMTGSIHHQLRDFSTKSVAILIYISTLVSGIGLSLYVIISPVLMSVTVKYVILPIFLSIQLWLFLGFLFIPILCPVVQGKLSRICKRLES